MVRFRSSTSKKILQYAVILLGFGLNLSEIVKVGAQSLPIILFTISTSLIISFVLYKAMKMPANISTLVGVGSSICGGSAIAATAPVIEADDEEIAQSISVIFLFNVIAALVFPALGMALGLSNQGFGLFAGIAVNDTSSVTAAAAAWDGMHPGANTLDTATIVKLTRTLAIIPITLALAFWRTAKMKKAGGRGESTFRLRKIFPFFILFFVLASVITTVSAAAGADVRFFAPPEGAFQIPDCDRHGGHRPQHKSVEAHKNGRQADLFRPLLLGRYRRSQPADAVCNGRSVILPS